MQGGTRVKSRTRIPEREHVLKLWSKVPPLSLAGPDAGSKLWAAVQASQGEDSGLMHKATLQGSKQVGTLFTEQLNSK